MPRGKGSLWARLRRPLLRWRRRRAIKAWATYRAGLEAFAPIQAIGAILARAQIIEEAMRMLIAQASAKYESPRDVRGTFGELLREFEALYPSQADLIELLQVARDARNDAAHYDLLAGAFIKELLQEHDAEAVDHFQRRGMRKTIEGMDWAMRSVLGFLRAQQVEASDPPSPVIEL